MAAGGKTAPPLNSELATWTTKTWIKHGGDIREFRVSHIYNGSARFVEDVKNLERFKKEGGIESDRIAREIQDVIEEHALKWPGTLTYEVSAWGEGIRHIRTLDKLKWQGKGEPEADADIGGSTNTSSNAMIAMFMQHERVMFKETTAAQAAVIADLRRELEAERGRSERLMKEYPVLLDLMSGLADQSLERTLKVRAFERTEKIKEEGVKLLFEHGPTLLGKVLGGKEGALVAAAGPLQKVFDSLKNDPEKFMAVMAALSDDDKRNLALAAEAFEAEKREQENRTSDIKVSTNGAP